eukprot:COSAG02_NODE_3217_length_7156_cov_5.216381_5_plen_167_part_00
MNVKSAYKSNESDAAKVSVAVEGRLNAVRHVREKGVPFLGIGVGMHVAVIESARALGGIDGANSEEFDIDCTHPVVCATSPASTEDGTDTSVDAASLPEEIVGARETKLVGGASASLLGRLYGAESFVERHCHSHIVNIESEKALVATGLRIVGKDAGEHISAVER